METLSENVLLEAVSEEEWAQIPEKTAKRIVDFVTEKLEELITAKALLETTRFNADKSVEELQQKYAETESTSLLLNEKLEAANRTIGNLEAQLSECTSEITKLERTCNRLEAEAAECRHQRHLAEEERETMSSMLVRRSAEVDRLKLDLNTLQEQLQAAIAAKCEALANANEVASLKLTLDYKERRIEQERALLQNQVDTLTESLNERTEELLNMKKDNALRCVQLEAKLYEKTQQLNVANETIKTLTDVNNTLTAKAEELTEILKNQRDNEAKKFDVYQQELEVQTKLAELYKGMADQNKEHSDELESAVAELQTLLKEATEKYGDLETKTKETSLANEEIICKKNEYIAMLKKELETSNEMFKVLKDESLQREVEELSPAAATASKLIKSGMSLTQIYTQYITVSEELMNEKDESRRLKSYIEHIVKEIEEKGPLLKKQREDFEMSMATVEELTQQRDSLVQEMEQMREDMLEYKKNDGVLTRENERLKKEVTDLSRQVCHLLREVEHSRAGSSTTSTDQDMSDSMSSGDIISKKLVTFSDIAELQSTNQRLLAVVRALSAKQEEVEAFDPTAVAELKMKMESMREAHANLLEQQNTQNRMVGILVGQRDMYKTLYEQAMKGNGDELPTRLESPFIRERKGSQSPKGQDDSDDHSDDKVQELEMQLEKTRKELEILKEENDTYRKEKSANEKILLEQMENMRQEVQELTRQNCRLLSVTEQNDQRFKIIQTNTEIYKNQIASLEKQNRIYSESIIKHEQSLSYLKDETLESQTKLSKAEVRLVNLEKENALLRDRESRLVKELEFHKRESHSQNLLQTNIELIKATLERNDAESRIRLEERLDEAHRECAALRRRLQEEQDRFRELGEHLEKQTANAQAQMQEERAAATKLREELAKTREDFIAKQNQLEDLTKQLKNNMIILPEEDRKYREIVNALEESKAQVELLQQQLKSARDTITQHATIAEGAEKQLQVVVEERDNQRKAMESKLKEREEQIKKLEEQCSELQGELSIHSEGDNLTGFGLKNRILKLEVELKNARSDLVDARADLERTTSEHREMSQNLEAAESKYAMEMMLHSKDLQALTSIKDELVTLQSQLKGLEQAKQQAEQILEEKESGWKSREDFLEREKRELASRFKDMDAQNALLLDQIQTLNTQLSLLQAQTTESATPNQSFADSSTNRSFTEDEVKSSDQLLKVIKYLRQEKDISVSKCEIMEAEHARLKSQHDLLEKQLREARATLEAERQKSEVTMVTTAKHAEVLRKVETLNAITDSNRTLRMERDLLAEQLNELRSRVGELEDKVAPLQERDKELSLRAETLQTENVTLRGEATRWRQRANTLIEKTNRTSPEDWKKLQSERENLAKQLTIEKGISAKLQDEVNTLKQDKVRLDEQVRNLKLQHGNLSDELDRAKEEINKLKEQVANLTQELEKMKQNNSVLGEDNQKLNSDLQSREGEIKEFKNNLLAVRKIAKKYKLQYEEQTKEIEGYKQELEEKCKEEASMKERHEQMRNEVQNEMEERLSVLEQSHNEKITELATSTEENENYKKEIDQLKQNSAEKEERFKNLFKNAKERIVTLTEQNNNLRTELESRFGGAKGDGPSTERNSELLAEIEQLQKEKAEIVAEKQQENERLSEEVESLTQKVNQLQRQLGQQSSKPSTSSGATEKPATEPPTANIKPMAGHSTNTQTQSVQIQPWRSTETPLASIRPMSMQLRTIAVLPTSQAPSTSQSPNTVMITPQQVHTTGPSNIEALSSSPTSSHTEYMPATSSATPAVVGPRQVAVPPTQSTQDTEDEDNNVQPQPAVQQHVALVMPRVEPTTPQESGTSSSSSNTVTTTQATLKRPREADTDQLDDQAKSQQQTKRTRVQAGVSGENQSQVTVTDSGLEVEYQVPTSSQRDHEEDTDTVIVVESDDEGDCPDEGEGADDDDGDDPDTEGYDMESYPEQELIYDDVDCPDMEEEEGGNEVEVIEDSSEVPNQSEHMQENIDQEESNEQAQSEAISSGTDGTSGITVSQASTSVAASISSFSRTRPVAPLSRQQQGHLILPHGLEEGGDDGIVPSTPILFVPRRSDGFGEAVSSPHVPTSGRFTFSEASTPPTNPDAGSTEAIPEQTLEYAHTDDNSTGRSVPSTPQHASPQESGPSGEEHNSRQSTASESIPTIIVSGAGDEAESAADGGQMGPPSIAGTSSEGAQNVEQGDETMEGEDGVSSEGEKPLTISDEASGEEEGREAEATPSTNTKPRGSMRGGTGLARRSLRNIHMRSTPRSTPTPIVWNEQHRSTTNRQPQGFGSPNAASFRTEMGQEQRFYELGRGRGQGSFSPRVARRSRGRSQRPYSRY